MSELRKTRYYVKTSVARAALGIPTPVLGWRWEGRGFHGELLARRPSVTGSGVPIPQMTAISEIWERRSFNTIYDQFFAGVVGANKLVNVTMATGEVAGNGVLWIDLNREEG